MAESRHHSEVNVDALLLAESHHNRKMDATYAVADDGSVVVKKKRRRRVSFAQTQTVHVIPRLEDLDQIDSATGNLFRKSGSSPGRAAGATFSVASPADLHEHTADFTCDMDTGHGSWADEATAVGRMSSDGMEDENGCFVHLGHLSREDEDSIVNDVANDDVTMDATTFTKNLSKFLKFGATFDSQGTGVLGKISSHKESESRSEDDSMNLTRPAPPHWGLLNNPDNVSVEDDDEQSDMSMATTTHKPRWKQKQNSLHENILSDMVLAAKEHGPAASDGKSTQPSINDKVEDFSQQHFVDDADSDSDSSMSVSNTMEMTLPKTHSKNSDIVVDIDICTPSSPMSRHESGTLMQDITFTATDYNGTLPVCNLKDLLTDHTSYTVTRPDVKVTESPNASSGKRPQSSQKDSKLGSPTSDDMTICSLSTGIKTTDEKKRSGKKRKQSVLSVGATQQNDTELNPMPDSPILQEPTFGSASKASLSMSRNMKCSSKQENVGHSTERDEIHPSEARLNFTDSQMKQDHSVSSNSRSAARDQNDRQGRTALANISNRDSLPPRSLDFSKGQKKDEKHCVVLTNSVVELPEEINNANSSEVIEMPNHVKGNTKEESACQTKRTSTNKANVTNGKIGSLSIHVRHSQSKGTMDSILQHLEGECPIMEFQDGEEEMKPSPQQKLQTLSDYLQFSCSVQPQMDWLNEHVQELSEKLKALKQKNADLRSQKHLLQKLKEEPMQMLKTKYEQNQRSARKEWLLWKINPERQNLAWLQENKDNLIKEVDAVRGKAQQVLQLKELYSQILLKEKISKHKEDSVQTAVTPSNSSKRFHPFENLSERENKEKKTVSESNVLEKCQHHYQNACERLNMKKLILKSIQCKIEDIASLYHGKLQLAPEITGEILAEKIKGSVERLIFTNSLLQQQQVMRVDIRSKGGKSQTSFSLEGIYCQNFLYEGDGPQVHVIISRSLNQEAVEMVFPCMEAFIAFEYLINDFPNTNPVQIQNIQLLTQATKWRVGSLMDLLKEIKFCNRSFRVSSKFQLRNDKLMLNVTSLFASHGLKITLTFDMTCIRVGKYPSDLKPTEVQVRDFGSQSNTHPITRRDVQARIGKLDPGFGRLYKICTCVEKLVRATKEML